MARADNEVPETYEVVVTRSTHCKGTIREGRYAGRRCGNASPCYEHDVRPLALNLQAQGPDEYPFGFYEVMARLRLSAERTMTGRRKPRNRLSVLW